MPEAKLLSIATTGSSNYIQEEARARRRMVEFKNIAVEYFSSSNWLELGSLTGQFDYVNNHPRLLRSLSFGDDDYDGFALQALMVMFASAPENYSEIELYLSSKSGSGGENISSAKNQGPRIYFQPTTFSIPTEKVDVELLSVMMPFSGSFSNVWSAIKEATENNGIRCERADNIWKQSAVIQDIFGLIFQSNIVVCDFTEKNPNVFYEAGIAHTLGKHVIPITQTREDIPFDLQHHRYIHYLDNGEGLADLTHRLSERISYLRQSQSGKF